MARIAPAILVVLAAGGLGWWCSASPGAENPATPAAAATAVAAKQPPSASAICSGREAIEKALGEPTHLECTETPLCDVIDALRKQHKIEIQLNRMALDDVGVSPDTPITKKLDGVSLRSALRLMLRELELTYDIQNEALLITTPEAAEANLRTEVYDVTDLVACRDDGGRLWHDHQSLIDVVQKAIAPIGWDNNGGAGTISGATFGATAVLVVRQDNDGHEQITALLKQIREVVRQHGDKDEIPRRNRPEPIKPKGPIVPTTPIPVVG